MKHRPAFTIIEVLIALSLSSIIIFGMMQTYNNVMRYLSTVQEFQSANRKACILFNQLERDISTAFIPPLLESKKPVKSGQGQPDEEPKDKDKAEKKDSAKTPKDKAKEDAKKKEKLKIYFVANINENELSKKINDQKSYPFKSVSLINTNPLQVYGQRRVRVVRVLYELVVDKARSKGAEICYNLYRKETEDLENFKAKENEFEVVKDKKSIVRKHLVADGIKEMFIQYTYQGYKKSDKNQRKKEVEELTFDTWGERKETIGVVPCRTDITISFWNDSLSKSITLQATFPVLSFSLIEEKEEEKNKKDKKNEDKSDKTEKVQEQVLQSQSQAPTQAIQPTPIGPTPAMKV